LEQPKKEKRTLGTKNGKGWLEESHGRTIKEEEGKVTSNEHNRVFLLWPDRRDYAALRRTGEAVFQR